MMSLAQARTPEGEPLSLPGEPPYPGSVLRPWAGCPIQLPALDPLLLDRDHPERSHPSWDNLRGMDRGWEEHSEWMDFLDAEAPNHQQKLLERALYLHHWSPWLPKPGERVLDLGGGVGRFSAALLDRGCSVDLLDPDLRSLWRALQHLAGRPGSLDLHWSTVSQLPPGLSWQAILAVEVLCYVEDPLSCLKSLRAALLPGGVLLGSVEARWGWAASLDAPQGGLEALLSGEELHIPEDRWVRCYRRESLEQLLREGGFELLDLKPTHYLLSGPFELLGEGLGLQEILAGEERLRHQPELAHLNRAWIFSARAR